MSAYKNTFSKLKKQDGAASIFVVIFFALLIGVITVSFVRIVNNDQQQALNNDLSQSAYDAAQAGVEDAKRSLDNCLKDSSCKPSIEDGSKFNGQGCEDTERFSGPGEVKVKKDSSSDSDEALNQAYTCVNIQYNTPTYENELKKNGVDIIPLEKVGEGSLSGITLKWFNKDNANSDTPNYPAAANIPNLPNSTNWPQNRPSLMRIQIITAADAPDSKIEDINNNARTYFLYPTKGEDNIPGAVDKIIVNSFPVPNPDSGRSTEGDYTVIGQKNQNEPVKVKCESGFTNTFACSISVEGLNTAVKNYLVIQPYYATETNYVLQTIGSEVFNGVQPKIDSTGRADDVFRRVETRVRTTKPLSNGAFNFESAASICKIFGLTNDRYIENTSCQTKL